MRQELNISVVWDMFSKEKNFTATSVAVSLENRRGKLDLLPLHANLISVIFNKVIFYTGEKITKTYEFETGVVEISENNVRFLLESKPDIPKVA